MRKLRQNTVNCRNFSLTVWPTNSTFKADQFLILNYASYSSWIGDGSVIIVKFYCNMQQIFTTFNTAGWHLIHKLLFVKHCGCIPLNVIPVSKCYLFLRSKNLNCSWFPNPDWSNIKGKHENTMYTRLLSLFNSCLTFSLSLKRWEGQKH